MLADCDLRNARVVVELGPGTGSFTRLIWERLGEASDFFALELDEASVKRLRSDFPGLEVCHQSAEDLPELLGERGIKADCVVSLLPLETLYKVLEHLDWRAFEPRPTLGRRASSGILELFKKVISPK